MISLPQIPSSGDRITAQLLRDIIQCLRRLRPIGGRNILLTSTPDGTIFEGTPGGGRVAGASDRSCWRIGTKTGSGGTSTEECFLDCYYTIGGVMHVYDADETVDDFVKKGELGEGEEYTADDTPYVAFRQSADPTDTEDAPAIVGYKEFDDLSNAMADVKHFTRPLYKLTHDGGIAIDYRTALDLQMGE